MRSVLILVLLLSCIRGSYAQHSFRKLDVNTKGPSNPDRFTSFKGKTYFVANDSIHGNELWWTDGQSFGMVADLTPGIKETFDEWYPMELDQGFATAADKLFFAANGPAYGLELYEYDGINPPQLSSPSGKDTTGGMYYLRELNGILYFIGWLPQYQANGLYSYNPGTRQYTLLAEKDYFRGLAVVKGRLVTAAFNAFGIWNLYVYDPLTQKLTKAPDPDGVASFEPMTNFYVYNDELFFLMNTDGKFGNELYRFDGSSAPRRITDIAANQSHSFRLWGDPSSMLGKNNKLYFMAQDGIWNNLFDLYSYDLHTDSITKLWKMDSYRECTGMAWYGGKLYFASDSSYNVLEGMYVWDGSTVKTFPYPGQWYSEKPRCLTESYGKLYFADREGYQGTWATELYVYVDSLALDVKEVEEALPVSVYPNPATREAHIAFTLQQTATLTIALTDVLGRAVYTAKKQYTPGKQEALMPLAGLSAGLYIYSVMHEDGTVLGHGKLVKE